MAGVAMPTKGERTVKPLFNGVHPKPCESIPQGEAETINYVLAHTESDFRKGAEKRLAKGKKAVRDAHTKPSGLVFGLATIEDDLAADLRVGLFETAGQQFPIIIRFSAGLPFEGLPDWAWDAHATAIKFFGVTGPNSFAGASVHDLIMTNYPCFFFEGPKGYEDMMRAGGQFRYLFPSLNPTTWRKREMALIWQSIKKIIPGVAETTSHSQVPYLWGDARDGKPAPAAKYMLRPVSVPAVHVSKLNWRYLSKTLGRQLDPAIGGPDGITLELLVQLQQPGETVEDARNIWQGKPRKLATLHIPPQAVDCPANWRLAEAISFNPGRGRVEQEPVGGIGRLRPILYELVSGLRSQYNGVNLDANGLPQWFRPQWLQDFRRG
jgi:hypothetical protein